MIDCPNGDVRDALPDYLHDRLDTARRRQVESHLAGCDACRAGARAPARAARDDAPRTRGGCEGDRRGDPSLSRARSARLGDGLARRGGDRRARGRRHVDRIAAGTRARRGRRRDAIRAGRSDAAARVPDGGSGAAIARGAGSGDCVAEE